MKLKQKWGSTVWEPSDSAELIRGTISGEPEDAIKDLSDIIGRMLDAMPLTEQNRLEIVDPYMWDIVKVTK
jgi:hypothetical protein